MTVTELIEILQDHDPDAEVRLGHQPSWPLQFTVAGVASSFDLGEGSEPDEEAAETTDAGEVVWIVEGSHPSNASPYAPGGLWDVARRH